MQAKWSGIGAALVDDKWIAQSIADRPILCRSPTFLVPRNLANWIRFLVRVRLSWGWRPWEIAGLGPCCWPTGALDPWLRLEAARAMGWCGIYDGADPLLGLMKQTGKNDTAAWAARCIGEMLDTETPSRLIRFIQEIAIWNPSKIQIRFVRKTKQDKSTANSQVWPIHFCTGESCRTPTEAEVVLGFSEGAARKNASTDAASCKMRSSSQKRWHTG